MILRENAGQSSQYMHPTKSELVTVAGQQGDALAPEILISILKQAGLEA